jgi:uncharacterized protein YukE
VIVSGDADGCAALGTALQRAGTGTAASGDALVQARAVTAAWKGVGARSWEDLVDRQSGAVGALADALATAGAALSAFAVDLAAAQDLAARARALAADACLSLSADGWVPPVVVPSGPLDTPQSAAMAAEAERRAAVRAEVLVLCERAREAQRDAHARLLRVLRELSAPRSAPEPRHRPSPDGPVLTRPQWPEWVDLANGLTLMSRDLATRAGEAIPGAYAQVRHLQGRMNAVPEDLRWLYRDPLAKSSRELRGMVGTAIDYGVRAERLRPVTRVLQYGEVPLSGLPVLRQVPGLSVLLAGAGFEMDRRAGMDTTTAAVKNTASTLAGVAATAALTGGAVAALPVVVGIAAGAAVGYGVGKLVEHWGDDVAEGVGDAANSVWGSVFG